MNMKGGGLRTNYQPAGRGADKIFAKREGFTGLGIKIEKADMLSGLNQS